MEFKKSKTINGVKINQPLTIYARFTTS